MKYMGSKRAIAKEICPIIQSYADKSSFYIEPFVGGANVLEHINHPSRIGIDKNMYLIELLKHVTKVDDLPQDVTREHYNDVREEWKKRENGMESKYEDWYIGAIGFLASYNGKFFDGGYAKSCGGRNFYDEARRNLRKQMLRIYNCIYVCGDYSIVDERAENCTIYCDPPYKGTTQYGVSKDFDYDRFYDWVIRMSKNNYVIFSEQDAPKCFSCIWEKGTRRTLNPTDKSKIVPERLFVYG